MTTFAGRAKDKEKTTFETEWIDDGSHRIELPVVLNMDALYQTLLKNIIPLPFLKDETLDNLVSRVEKLRGRGKRPGLNRV